MGRFHRKALLMAKKMPTKPTKKNRKHRATGSSAGVGIATGTGAGAGVVSGAPAALAELGPMGIPISAIGAAGNLTAHHPGVAEALELVDTVDAVVIPAPVPITPTVYPSESARSDTRPGSPNDKY